MTDTNHKPDSDYIPAEQRWFNSSSIEVNAVGKPLIKSHAVADSVMHELADALRWMYDGGDNICSCWRCNNEGWGPCRGAQRTREIVAPALERYDRLAGNNE